ncbi:ice-binding family protein [Streptosporangium sp. NPDC050855]|uniref:ice-binding family protein n=1 Tax=Streptosporangium sp. NPDC050855 TaxID=3366194 RepID=UPI0037A952F5
MVDRRPFFSVPRKSLSPWRNGTVAIIVAMGTLVAAPHAAYAAEPVELGTAGAFAVLGGSTVTNTGATVLTGDLGVSPGTAITGFPPGTVSGTVHAGDTAAAQAQSDLTIAYDDAAAQPSDAVIPTELGGTTVTPGTYTSAAGTFGITGEVILDAQGDPDAVFIFKAASTLITAAASTVTLTGGAQACNVFWLVGSSATLGASSDLAGTVLALASITAGADVTVDGRLLARNGAVTLDSDTVTVSQCAVDPPRTTTTTVNSSCAMTQQGPITFTATVRSSSSVVPSGPVEFFADGVSLGTAQLDATGHADLTVSGLTEGARQITAVFPGTDALDPSTSAVFTQDVDADGFCLVPACGQAVRRGLQTRSSVPRRNV